MGLQACASMWHYRNVTRTPET